MSATKCNNLRIITPSVATILLRNKDLLRIFIASKEEYFIENIINMAQNIDQSRNNIDATNIPIFCLPKRDEDFRYDENIQNFNTDHQSIQKCIRCTDLLESLCYDHNLNVNATKVTEFLSSEYDYVQFNIHASRIPNMICLKYEANEERQDIIRTNSPDYRRKENQDSPLILQNIPKDTNKYMEVYAEIYPNDKSFCYIINEKIFLHLRNWHCIYRSNPVTTFCFVCHMNIDPTMEGIKIHTELQKHLERLELMKKHVLTEFGYSIVTEVSSKKYFCSVCTMVFGSLKTVRVHCSNKKHVKSLEKRMDRAQRFLAELDKERVTNTNTDNEDNVKNKLPSRPKISLNMTEVRESNELNDNSFPPNTTKTDNAQQIVSVWRNDGGSSKFMEANVERVRSSFVINGQVSLLKRNWHTFAGTKKALFCVLCNENVKNTHKHISGIEHTDRLKLRSNNILEEFGYSIVMETGKKDFYHCGVCNVIIHTLPGMRVHCRTQGHLKEYERLMNRAQRLLGKVAGQENETTGDDMPPMNGPELGPRESRDLSNKYMTICSVKRDYASFLINEKIALVRSKWHEFLRRDGQYYCVLCQKDFSKMDTHMKNRYHKQLMGDKERRILAEFGYGMVSETPVKDFYHCAVCNIEIQGISTVRVHAVSEEHLLLIKKHIEKAKKILERVPRTYNKDDCVLRNGTFHGDDEEYDPVFDYYVDF